MASRSKLHDSLLTDAEHARFVQSGYGLRVGFGARPAIIAIDCQNYMVGPDGGPSDEYPSAIGAPGQEALDRLAKVLKAARQAKVPIVYTRMALRPDGADLGVLGRKRRFKPVEGWCLEGTTGAEISSTVRPSHGDLILNKTKYSAFFATPLLSVLQDWHVDTVILAGGSTSTCVRATAVDAASYNFRTIVIEDCVFDRFEVSHRVALFDMDRQFADVVASSAVIERLRLWTRTSS